MREPTHNFKAVSGFRPPRACHRPGTATGFWTRRDTFEPWQDGNGRGGSSTWAAGRWGPGPASSGCSTQERLRGSVRLGSSQPPCQKHKEHPALWTATETRVFLTILS